MAHLGSPMILELHRHLRREQALVRMGLGHDALLDQTAGSRERDHTAMVDRPLSSGTSCSLHLPLDQPVERPNLTASGLLPVPCLTSGIPPRGTELAVTARCNPRLRAHTPRRIAAA